jgi:phage terminase large subunit
MVQVVIPYKPRPWSLQLHNTDKRWIVLVIHRRAGKTTAALNHLQRDALKTPQSRWAYIAPTYKQAKNIAWDLLKIYSRVIPGIEYNEAELTVKYPNGSKLTLYGADNPDSLRGIGLWGVVFDEYSQQPSNIFTEIIRPALADHRGYAIWIGTPKGKNEFYRLYEQGREEEAWLSLLLTVDDTGIVPQAELDDARKTMTADEFNQEWYCSFEAAIKGAIYSQELALARQQGRVKAVPYDPALKVHVVPDLGVGQAFSIGFYQRVGNEVHMIDYWQGSEKEGIPTAGRVLREKPYVYGTYFLPHDAEGTEQATEKTRRQSIESLWPQAEVVVIDKLPVEGGITKGRLMFPRLWVNEQNCQLWLDAISQYKTEWDDKRGMFRERPLHDWTSHAADVHRYAATVEGQMINDNVLIQQAAVQENQRERGSAAGDFGL